MLNCRGRVDSTFRIYAGFIYLTNLLQYEDAVLRLVHSLTAVLIVSTRFTFFYIKVF